MIDVKVEGMEEFINSIDKLVENLKPDKVEPILNSAARAVSKELRKNAPSNDGVLKKAIVTKKLKRWGNTPAPSIAAVNRKRAPHAHLVEYGTSGSRQVNPGRMVNIGGQAAFITNTGRMPANPFFRKTINATLGPTLARIEQGIGKLIDEGMK